MGVGDGIGACTKIPHEIKMALVRKYREKRRAAQIASRMNAIVDLCEGHGSGSMATLADAAEALAQAKECSIDDVRIVSKPPKAASKQRTLDELAQVVDKETLDLKVGCIVANVASTLLLMFECLMQLLLTFVKNGIPFNVITDKHFRDFISLLQQFKGEYVPPSDYPLRTTLLQKGYDVIKASVDVSFRC